MHNEPFTRKAQESQGKRSNNETQATIATATTSDEEFFDWPASDDEDLGRVADEALDQQSPTKPQMLPPKVPETPRKSQKTEMFSTPSSKRRFDDMDAAQSRELGAAQSNATIAGYPTPISTDKKRDIGEDIFTTPSTTLKPGMRLFADATPTPSRFRDASTPTARAISNGSSNVPDPSILATEIFSALADHNVSPPVAAVESVRSICNRHALHMHGITRGRDVSREMVKSKEDMIVDLRKEIDVLKSERQTNRAVITQLRSDMMTRTPGRGGRR